MSSQDTLQAEASPETEALRRDVLTGHLLALATEDGLPRHALPALATSLQVHTFTRWINAAMQGCGVPSLSRMPAVEASCT